VIYKLQPYHFEPEGTLEEEDEILMLKSNYNSLQSREGSYDIKPFQFSLPAFKSGFRCSCNGGPPVIWIIFLYIYDIRYIS